MRAAKKKSVVSTTPEHVAEVEKLVAAGRYRSVSAFVREAMAEKLERLARDRVAEQVARYCATEQDDDLIAGQAFDGDEPGPGRAK